MPDGKALAQITLSFRQTLTWRHVERRLKEGALGCPKDSLRLGMEQSFGDDSCPTDATCDTVVHTSHLCGDVECRHGRRVHAQDGRKISGTLIKKNEDTLVVELSPGNMLLLARQKSRFTSKMAKVKRER